MYSFHPPPVHPKRRPFIPRESNRIWYDAGRQTHARGSTFGFRATNTPRPVTASPLRLLAAGLLLAGCAAPAPPLAQDAREADPHAPAPPGWRQHDFDRPPPPRVEPAPSALTAAPPSDAVVLIGPDGAGAEGWETESGEPAPWTVEGDALVLTPGGGTIRTKASFGDVQLHAEWMPADEPEKTNQDRSNSGLFLVDGRYEVQVLDVWENRTYNDGRAGAIYGQFPPLADASRPPGAWQSFDIFFRMPRFGDGGELLEEARMTVLHNGVLVQNNEVLPGTTMWLESLPYVAHGAGPHRAAGPRQPRPLPQPLGAPPARARGPAGRLRRFRAVPRHRRRARPAARPLRARRRRQVRRRAPRRRARLLDAVAPRRAADDPRLGHLSSNSPTPPAASTSRSAPTASRRRSTL